MESDPGGMPSPLRVLLHEQVEQKGRSRSSNFGLLSESDGAGSELKRGIA